MVSLAHVQGQMRASSLNALSQMVQRHPDESLAVLRRWLDPEDRL
jgi:flagellar M-ring protein FliF